MKGQLPRKLNASFRPAEQLQAISCALEESTTAVPKATLTLPPGAEPLQIHELVELFVGEESHGYFRVVSSGVNLRNQITHQLMGAADTLTDDVWAAQVAETTYTPAALFTAALTHQSVQRWQKGRCDAAVSVKTAISYDDLWTVLEKIRAENPDCMWQYDYTTTPWTLSLVEMQETIESELRIGRNIESATINITDKEMCNRLYMTVTSDNGSTLVTAENTESINKYGVVVKLATVTAQEAPNPQAYAAAILAERAEPIAYISIGGLDLKEITGDEFDRVKLGTKCRAVIPEYRETPLSERVVAKKWPDVIHEPERVTVSLANAIQTFSENLQFIRRTASSARSSASKTEKDLTHWEQIVTAQQTALDDLGITGLWQSGLVLDAYEGVKIWSSEQGVNSYLAQIAVNRTSINQAVEAVGLEWDDTANEGAGGWVPSASPAAGSVAARLALIPGQISAAASSVMSDVRAEGYIKLQAAKDAAAAEIGAQLDNGSSTISAKVKTLVEGDQSLIQLIANAVQITAGDVTVSGNIKLNDVITIENGVAKGTFGSLVITGGANLGSTNVYFNSVPLASFIKSISLTGPTNNEYTLTWENAGGNSTSKTFSRAASGVTVSWSGTTGTVTVNPQNQNFTITYPGPSSASVDSITITNTPLTGTLYTGSGGTRYAQTTENLTAWHNESDGEGGTTQTSLLDTSATVRVNIESILSAAENAIKVTGPTWGSSTTNSSNTATFTTDAPTPVSGAAKELKLYLSRSNDWTNNVRTVYLSHTDSSAANRVAQIEVDASTLVSNAASTARTQAVTDATLSVDTPYKSGNVIKIYPRVTFDQNTTKSANPMDAQLPGVATNSSGTPSAVTGSLTSGSTVYPYVQIGSEYFYGSALTVPSGSSVNVESSRSYTMTGNTATITPSNGYDAMAQVEVDATSRYYAGKAAVTLGSHTWEAQSGSSTPSSRYVQVKTVGRTNASGTTEQLDEKVYLYLSVTCANGTATARLKDNDTITVMEATTTYNEGSGDPQEEGNTYADGWADALANVELERSPDTSTPTYSTTVTVTAKAKATPTASSKTAISGATTSITTPADSSGGGTITAVAGITYNSSSHTYTASAQAKRNGTVVASDTKNSGTEAYAAGQADGYSNNVTLTRYRAGAVSSIIPGQLYRKNSDNTYTAIGSSSTYWYGCSTDLGSSKKVYYP